MGSGIEILPTRRDETVSSSSGDAVSGSAKRSPATIASENEFFVCSLEIFSKIGKS